MSRFARNARVFFFEEPVYEDVLATTLRVQPCKQTGVEVCTPVLPNGTPREAAVAAQRQMLDQLVLSRQINDFVAWYYTPMAREFSRHLHPAVTVYDCMDELSAFAGAPPDMRANELELFECSDLVFTGGSSLYESKRKQHARVHCFPSSVDVEHFRKARRARKEPVDQSGIPRPRLGYAGVIDERMDIGLLREVASLRPAWHFVLIGPVVKINSQTLPQAPNLHYLGMKAYDDLPAYFSGWSIGMLPFALNDATKFISPTKTPEYLAAGLRVISSPIRDVVTPYGDLGLAGIAQNAGDFIRVAENLLTSPQDSEFERRADAFLSKSSWDQTWSEMNRLIDGVHSAHRIARSGTSAAVSSDLRGEAAHV